MPGCQRLWRICNLAAIPGLVHGVNIKSLFWLAEIFDLSKLIRLVLSITWAIAAWKLSLSKDPDPDYFPPFLPPTTFCGPMNYSRQPWDSTVVDQWMRSYMRQIAGELWMRRTNTGAEEDVTGRPGPTSVDMPSKNPKYSS